MEKKLFFFLCLSRLVGVVSSQIYVGPNLDPGLGSQSGGAGYYILDGVTLPSGTITGLEYYIDRSSTEWSPFILTIFRPIGTPSTTTQYEIVGVYPITSQPSVVTGITGENFTGADYIVVNAGDHIAFYNSRQHVSITAQFDATSGLSTRFSVPTNPVPTTGDTVTIDALNLGPTFYSLRVLLDQLALPGTCANVGNSYCDHNCTDKVGGGYQCSCRPGFTLQTNGYSCVDDDLNGFIGEQGRTGEKGERGLQGPKGQQGITGQTGPIGPQGATGLQGVQGATGVQGQVGPAGSTGVPGIKGQPGDQGLKGQKGSMGLIGVTGPMGPVGLVGATGLPGIDGLNGAGGQKGEKGDKGAAGPPGIKGERGTDSAEGETGMTGPKGNIGTKGDSGLMGMVGPTGPMGATGQKGPIYQEIDECQTNNHKCEHNCVNTVGSFYCTCNPGYTLRTVDNRTCVESQECLEQNGGCQHTCTERPGGYVCSCTTGYDLGPDRHSCIDKNECSNATRCSSNETCVNTPGSSMCLPSSADTAAVLACTRAESQRIHECQYGSGLVSGNTVIGFIVWLALLTILVLGILGCVLCINNNNRRGSSKSYDRRSDYWEEKSGTAPTRFSSIRTRLPDYNYTYY